MRTNLKNGADADALPEYHEARQLALAGKFVARPPRAVLTGFIPEAQDAFMRMLARRHWDLMITDAKETGGFVTSDSPVVWGDFDEIIRGARPSLGDLDVEVTFPLSRDLALVSHPDAGDGNCDAPEETVAHINSRTVHTSHLILFAKNDFPMRTGDGSIGRGREYMAYMADARRRGILRP